MTDSKTFIFSESGSAYKASVFRLIWIAPSSFLRHVGRLHRRTRTSGAVDRTRYGSVRMSPKSYFVHHTQQLSKAAVVGEGASIRRRIVLKQKRPARPLPRIGC